MTRRTSSRQGQLKKVAAIIAAATIFEIAILRWAVRTTPLEMGFIQSVKVGALVTFVLLWYFVFDELL